MERAKNLKVSSGFTPGADLGPLITKESKERVHRLIQSGADQGAQILLDGRNITVLPTPSKLELILPKIAILGPGVPEG